MTQKIISRIYRLQVIAKISAVLILKIHLYLFSLKNMDTSLMEVQDSCRQVDEVILILKRKSHHQKSLLAWGERMNEKPGVQLSATSSRLGSSSRECVPTRRAVARNAPLSPPPKKEKRERKNLIPQKKRRIACMRSRPFTCRAKYRPHIPRRHHSHVLPWPILFYPLGLRTPRASPDFLSPPSPQLARYSFSECCTPRCHYFPGAWESFRGGAAAVALRTFPYWIVSNLASWNFFLLLEVSTPTFLINKCALLSDYFDV